MARKRRKDASATENWLKQVNPEMMLEDLKKQKQISDLQAPIEIERSPGKNPRGGGAFSNRRKF